MTTDNERRLAEAENKLANLSVRDALNQLTRRGVKFKPESYNLLPDILRGDLVEHGDEHRIAGQEHKSLADAIGERLKSEPGWYCFVEPQRSAPADDGDNFDLNSFKPGQATDEQRKQLRAAIERMGAREAAARKGQGGDR